MNAKKAKVLRRAARQLAAHAGIPEKDEHLINTRTRTVRVGRCEKGLERHLQKQIKAGKLVIAGGKLLRVDQAEVK
jgi:hypothetical protein